LVSGVTALLQKKNRKAYPVWRSLLPPPDPKSYVKSSGVHEVLLIISQNLWGSLFLDTV